MPDLNFQAWPKIARLHKDIVVTEKIDGTNAAVAIADAWDLPELAEARAWGGYHREWIQQYVQRGRKLIEREVDGQTRFYLLAAQSRKQLIYPDKDNFGFARWAYDNAEQLLDILGAGRHFGEWWGSGIQRGYGLPKGRKRFSLFNVAKHENALDAYWHAYGDDVPELHDQLDVVPVLYEGPFSEQAIEDAMQRLDDHGSVASPGFKQPEGVVVYHTAANTAFKWTFDDAAKGTPYTPPEPLTKTNGVWA